MIRTELLEKLTLAQPALNDGTLIPVLSHFWFTGTHLMAYNDLISISTPLETDFSGAIPGETLVSLLKASRSKELTIGPDKSGNVLIKAGTGRFKLPLLPPDAFIFEMPVMPDGKGLPKNAREELVDAFKTCLMSVGTDTSVPEQLGVTVIPDGEKLLLFSTNFATMTHVTVPVTGSSTLKERVILPRAFVQQFVQMVKGGEETLLVIRRDHAMFKVGETQVFGRLIETNNPLDFPRLLKSHLPKDHEKLLSDIPAKMKLILDRAVIIADSKIDQQKTVITAQEGEITFTSKSERGEVRDTMKASTQQTDVEIMVEPKLIRTGCDGFDKYLITKGCVAMTRGNAIYMVATN